MELPPAAKVRSSAPSSSDAMQTSDANERCAMEIDSEGTAAGKRKLPEPLDCEAISDANIRSQIHSTNGESSRSELELCCGSGSMDKRRTVEIQHGDMPSADQQGNMEIQHGDMSAEEEEMQLVTRKPLSKRDLRVDDRNIELLDLLERNLTAKEHYVLVAAYVLHMIRCREFTEYNPKMYCTLPTRFCRFNIAFFDLDKASTIERGPSSSTINESNVRSLNDSINVISINVAESDVDYPINIYGTVLARDECDYRCVYLFKRGRDDPQLISSSDDTLTLTGPYRALTVTDSMFFELDLKIKCDGEVDKDFSKGLLEHNAVRYRRQPMILSLKSRLSTIDIVYTPVPFAVEASLEALILKGTSNFTGKVTAWTSENDKNKIVLYDNAVACSQTILGNDGSVPLTRRIVAVPVNEYLVLDVLVCNGDHGAGSLQLILGNEEEECSVTQGPYELQVKIIWTAVTRRHPTNMWQKIEDDEVLCSIEDKVL